MEIELLGEKIIPINEDDTILAASLNAGITHVHVCGGNRKYSTCRVLVVEKAELLTPPNDKDKVLSERIHFPNHVRLACQTHVTGDGVKVSRILQDQSDIELYINKDEVPNNSFAAMSLHWLVFSRGHCDMFSTKAEHIICSIKFRTYK